MTATTVQPAGADNAITVDHCNQCGGHWLDAGEAKHVAPFFAFLDRRHMEIALTGKSDGTFPCVRCDQETRRFMLLDVEIDYCLSCSGVWVDGEDAKDRIHLKDGTVSRGHVYRVVQKTQGLESVKCATCQRTVATDKTYLSSMGLICRTCYFAIAQRRQEMVAQESAPVAPTGLLAEQDTVVIGMGTDMAVDGLSRVLSAVHKSLFGS